MELDVMLCDHAEAHQGKLFINGAGINLVFVSPQPPHVVSLYLAAVVQVPYTQTNQMHTLTVKLLDEDGNPVIPWTPEGVIESAPPVQMDAQFNVGRPPILPPGEAQTVPLAFG